MTPARWLLLPGLDGSGRLFAPFLEQLAGIDAVVVRYPERIVADLDAYARHAAESIGDAQRCIVIAESFSGPVALRLRRFDPRIAAIVLVASFVRCPHPLLRMLPLAALASVVRHAAVAPLLRMLCLDREAPRELVGELRDVVRALPADVLGTRLALLRSLDEAAALRALSVPLLHLRAVHDCLVSGSLRHSLMEAPSVEEVAMDGPHFLLQTRPRACRDAILDWLARTAGQVAQRVDDPGVAFDSAATATETSRNPSLSV